MNVILSYTDGYIPYQSMIFKVYCYFYKKMETKCKPNVYNID